MYSLDRKCWEEGPKSLWASCSCFSLSSTATCMTAHREQKRKESPVGLKTYGNSRKHNFVAGVGTTDRLDWIQFYEDGSRIAVNPTYQKICKILMSYYDYTCWEPALKWRYSLASSHQTRLINHAYNTAFLRKLPAELSGSSRMLGVAVELIFFPDLTMTSALAAILTCARAPQPLWRSDNNRPHREPKKLAHKD